MKKPNKILSFLVALSMITTSMVGLASVSYAEGEEAPIAVEDNLVVDGAETPELEAQATKTEYYDETFEDYEVGVLVTQKEELQTLDSTDGKFTFGVMPRGGSGGTGVSIIGDETNKYMIGKSGRWSTGGSRNAYVVFNEAPALKDIEGDFVLDFDTILEENSNITFNNGTKDAAGTTVLDIKPGAWGLETDTWYNLKIVVGSTDKTKATLYILKENRVVGIQKDITLPADAAFTRAELCSVANGGAVDTIDAGIDNFKMYSTSAALHKATLSVTANGTPLEGATVNGLDGEVLTTDTNGQLEVSLPNGVYQIIVSAEGYLNKATELTINGDDVQLPITMEVRPAPEVTKIEIAGGQEYIYTPVKVGVKNSTQAYTAVVYDQSDFVMDTEEVTWSLETPVTGVSIDSDTGVVSVDNTVEGFEKEDSVIKVNVVATSTTKTDVKNLQELTIRNKQVPKNWKIQGNYAIQAGSSETYTAIDVINQYGEAYPSYESEDYVISFKLKDPVEEGSTPLLTFDGLKATAAAISTDAEKVNVVSKCGTVEKDLEFTVWGNNTAYYEAGVSTVQNTTDGRVAAIGDNQYWVLPDGSGGTKTTTVTLPTPFELEKGEAAEISWKSTWVDNTTTTYKRTLELKDSDGNSLLKEGAIHFSEGKNIGFGAAKVDNVFQNKITLGSFEEEAGKWIDISLVLKKSNSESGTMAATITVNGQTTSVEIAGKNIASIELSNATGSPASRLVGFKDFSIKKVAVSDFEFITDALLNDTDVAKVAAQTITRDYEVSVFGELAQDEVLTWDFSGAGAEGLTFTPNAEDQTKASLAITAAATPGAYTITVTSSNPEKEPAQLTVNVHDLAEIASFDISGIVTLPRGGSATYTVSNIIDEYGDPVTFAPVWSVAPTDTGAEIDPQTGVLTTTDQTGDVTVTATLGNPGKEKSVDYIVKVGDFTYKAENPTSTEIDVSSLINYGSTKYKVVVKTAEGVTTSEKTAVEGKITLDTIDGVLAVEVIPCYLFDLGDGAVETGYTAVKSTDVFSAATGYGLSKAGTAGTGTLTGVQADGITNMNTATFQVALPDGTYDFTFYKMDTPRTSISVNGNLVAARVDADGLGSGVGNDAITPSVYTVKDIKVTGGMAEISTSEKSFALAGVDIVKKSEYEVRKTHIYLAGDSTVSNYYPIIPLKEDYPDGERRTGWGQLFDMFLSDEVIVDNLALSGAWADSWAKGTFPTILANGEVGDYLFIQFGINDRNNSSTSEMMAAIDMMVKACYEKGMIPVLLNPQVCIKQYGEVGEYEQSYGSGNAGFYRAIMDYAKQNNVLYLDLTELSGSYFAMIGKTATNTMYFLKGNENQDSDSQHMSYKGALKVAELVATGIYDRMANGAEDAHGNTFAGIPLNSLVQYDITYTNSESQTVTEKFTAVECERKQTGATAFVPSEDQGIALKNTLNISEPTVVGGKINVDVTNNMLAEPKDVTVYVASYDENGVCVGVSVASGKVRPQKTTTLTADAPTEGADTTKVMVWDTSEMDPLAQAKAPSQSAQ
jgi:lysophospholipase L1-like esterase